MESITAVGRLLRPDFRLSVQIEWMKPCNALPYLTFALCACNNYLSDSQCPRPLSTNQPKVICHGITNQTKGGVSPKPHFPPHLQLYWPQSNTQQLQQQPQPMCHYPPLINTNNVKCLKHGQQKVEFDQVSLLLHSPSINSRGSRECLTTAARKEDVRVEASIDGVQG